MFIRLTTDQPVGTFPDPSRSWPEPSAPGCSDQVCPRTRSRIASWPRHRAGCLTPESGNQHDSLYLSSIQTIVVIESTHFTEKLSHFEAFSSVIV